MEYEVGEVYLWKGGECPLPKGTRVHIRLGKSDMSSVSEDWNKLRDATFSLGDMFFLGETLLCLRLFLTQSQNPSSELLL